jgi:hypothetical protein
MRDKFILIIIVIILTFGCQNKKNTDNQVNGEQENMYLGLRNIAFSMSHKDLSLNSDSENPYGAIMEFTLDDNYVTIVSYKTGDASIYLSTGGGFIGGIGHDNVKNASINFIKSVTDNLTLFKKAENNNLPPKGYVNFYALTENGLFLCSDKEKKIQNMNNIFFDMYVAAQNIITEYSKISQ